MNRFYVTPDVFEKEVVTISGDDYKHLSKVLRLKEGEVIEVLNNNGLKALGEIIQIGDDGADVKLLEREEVKTENPYHVSLFQSYPKGSKLETVCQKMTENGVNTIIPFYSKRSVVKPSRKEFKKIDRLKKVVKSAGEQSGRGIIPTVESPVDFKTVLSKLSDYDLVLVAYESETGQTLKKTLNSLKHKPERIAIIIGPEGGFDPIEIEALKQNGAEIVSLGKRILRTETAGMVLLSQLNFFYE